MMDGDYIELADVEHGTDVLQTLVQLLDPAHVKPGDDRSFPTVSLGGDVEMIIDEVDEDQTLLAISHSKRDATARGAAARRVYRTLAERTGWTLRWSADNRTDVVANRGPEGPRVTPERMLSLVKGDSLSHA